MERVHRVSFVKEDDVVGDDSAERMCNDRLGVCQVGLGEVSWVGWVVRGGGYSVLVYCT